VLVQQGADLQRAGGTLPELAEQVGERESGVDDVLDQHHVPPVDVGLEVMDDAHTPGLGGVGRDGEEVDLDRRRHGPHQVGEEEHAPFEHRGEQDAGGVVGRQLGGQSGDGGLQLLAADELAR